MKKFMTYAKDRKGITIVMIALMMFLLLALLGMAVDIAQMYFAKNQLQVAADASALAGASQLDISQTAARNTAWQFACKNSASPPQSGVKNVFLVSNGATDCTAPPANLNISNDPDGDIVLGHWDSDPTANPRFDPTGTPVNAVKVIASRTSASAVAGIKNGGNPVRVFIGRVFRFIGIDWSYLNAKAVAIATMPVKASSFITLCELACYEGGTSCIYPNAPCTFPVTPRILSRNPGTPVQEAFAWTSLLNHITSTSELAPLICETTPYVNLCGHQIWTTQGETSTPKKFESAMFDPSFDKNAKDCMSTSTGVVGKCSIVTGDVIGWTIIVPIVTTANCPPAAQPYPLDIFGYAKIHLKAICAPGVGVGALCDGRPFSAPAATCAPCGNNCIIVDQIQCISCSDPNDVEGLKPALVK